MSSEAIAQVLRKYLPEPTVDTCTEWIIRKDIHLKITKGRASKYGDYRPPGHGKGHRISVNYNLNPYAFLVTFVHEVAHLTCFEKLGPVHEPHGKTWKAEFRSLMSTFMNRNILPANVENALAEYLKNPAASSCSDPELHRALKSHNDDKNTNCFHLEELPENAYFRIQESRSGQVFKKGQRIRSRYHCKEVGSGRIYFVSGIAEVEEVKPVPGSVLTAAFF